MKRLLPILFAVLLGAAAWAQAPPAKPPAAPPPAPGLDVPPALAETDRLKIVNASQTVEIWTLKLQQAASEVQRARADFDKLVASVTPPGWQLNEKLEFVKIPKDGGGR